jgi:hypothetical protein
MDITALFYDYIDIGSVQHCEPAQLYTKNTRTQKFIYKMC